jgi:hypothetical protein
MELLLALLSLLTAATGAVAGARAPEPGVHQSAHIVSVAPARRAAVPVAVAPQAGQTRADEENASPAATEPGSAAPLYADRRRE